MVVIGTWNLENLFRPAGPSDEEAYDTKLAALRDTITAISPDVLAVQEVGDPAALDDLAGRLPGQWHTACSGHPDSRGIRVGFLSRLPLTVVADSASLPPKLAPVQIADPPAARSEQLGRGALVVRVEDAPGTTLTLITCHLKSKLLTYPGGRFAPRDEGERGRYGAYALYRRTAEAAAVRDLATSLLQSGERQRLIVLGDLNDEATAATTQILLGPPGSEIGTAGFDRPDAGDRLRLWNLASLIPADHRYSRVNNGRRELIDHILVSHALVKPLPTVDVSHAGKLPSVTDLPSAHVSASGSDHAPVFVTFPAA
ncbi:endonuclease/exonuclease/phosphatase family metal-dependent hydrolase [Amycolatopsis lexingtonensis]|uniref:Endonuclease/exonuclease/phosphatase family metal-dependent hydrolase n=1 Tax=Amycolatopsis lexingtonensis TaxID=218822 RepID=A0ABR9HSX6_9PSEU|nr:endonuclease/exonuclease/phosphatase family protein [Amycolatopsis lexingtonensis]MBE1493867.1 endonuclease/exonuclease/phosphatase family metal-dependent hydrolase [Amycolatopsis lexingtonensis]